MNTPPQSRICPLCSGEHFGSIECPFRCERCKVNIGQCFEEACPRAARWRAEQEAAEKTGTLFAASENSAHMALVPIEFLERIRHHVYQDERKEIEAIMDKALEIKK